MIRVDVIVYHSFEDDQPNRADTWMRMPTALAKHPVCQSRRLISNTCVWMLLEREADNLTNNRWEWWRWEWWAERKLVRTIVVYWRLTPVQKDEQKRKRWWTPMHVGQLLVVGVKSEDTLVNLLKLFANQSRCSQFIIFQRYHFINNYRPQSSNNKTHNTCYQAKFFPPHRRHINPFKRTYSS